MKPAILIECGPEAYCLRRKDGQEAVGAYFTRESALDAAKRREWQIVAVEKPLPTKATYGRKREARQ